MAASSGIERDALVERAAGLADAYVTAGEPPGLAALIRRYYAEVAPDDLAERRVEDLTGAARSHWLLGAHRRPGDAIVRVSNPHPGGALGWSSPHTVVEIVTDDMPFLVDSVTMEIDRHGLGLQLVVHPIVKVRRDRDGNLIGLVERDGGSGNGRVGLDPGGDADAIVVSESFIHVETDRTTDPAALDALRRSLERILADVRAATSDWVKMLAALRRVSDDLGRRPPPVAPDELIETRALLDWMADHHFTLLGFREYELTPVDGSDVLRPVAATGLGVFADAAGPADPDAAESGVPSATVASDTAELRRAAHEHALLVITKANERSTVHRPVYLDSIAVQRYDATGAVAGESRFVGLWTSAAYSSSPIDIPLLRHKVASVVRRAGFAPSSHSGKDLIAILESYPRDELFQIDEDDLFRISMGILALQERRRVRVFLRRDPFQRFVSALVFVPRDRYNTALRLQIDSILTRAVQAVGSEWNARVTESVLARLHFTLRTVPGGPTDVDEHELAGEIEAACRSWSDELRDALVAAHGEVHGHALARRYGNALPPAYRDDVPAHLAVDDIAALEQVHDTGTHALRLDAPARDGTTTFSVFSPTELSLSDVMPLLTNLGVAVVDERPYEVRGAPGTAPADAADGGDASDRRFIERFRLRLAGGQAPSSARRDEFEATFAAVLRGDAENDGFNALVLGAGLTWREAALLRAYARYLRQVGTLFSHDYIAGVLLAHPDVARSLVDLFRGRFDPDTTAPPTEQQSLAESITASCDAIARLDDDRILRAYLHLVIATLRTNWFQRDDDGRPPAHVALKLAPHLVPDLPKPAPAFEVFVYSPRVEGVHLRMGRVARGGLRWSDRREDFRTEILGLVKAQTVKNAVIVPVGAKGGFVPKQLPAPSDRDAWVAAGVEAYKVFVGALLDVTDNMVDGTVVPPARVVRYDGDDPYLVVAADKGTATFSDIANEIAVARGFWLGDAFASGGSAGYDHKAMGITARGAWESVRSHFRRLGVDPDVNAFTVVGIGDMSGDVFGNGMVLSEHIELVAAFDHRHVFLDPDPDPAVSFAERRRLFELPRSSWADYDASLISEGGGVYARTLKSVPISAPVRRALALATDVEALTPAELIGAILRAPVDLLWNGGIGTYVKASGETHAEVGDKTNDAVRVDATALRCRVIGEGGNLGVTQRGRIEFALRGGLVNTDAIDNSAGVDTSDHEVNIKILLDRAVHTDRLSIAVRDELLASMTADVAQLVLADNYDQNRVLANARSETVPMLDVHTRYLRSLEQSGRLDRALEFLPGDEEIVERRNHGQGLTVPELAVLLAYTKISLTTDVGATTLPDDPDLAGDLRDYFPRALHGPYGADIASHPLRRDITTTVVVNHTVNVAGISLAFRLAEETGATPADIVRAHYVAWRVFDQERVWQAIAALDHAVAADAQTAMYLESRKLVERGTRWFLRNRRSPLPLHATIDAMRPGVHRCSELLAGLLRGNEAQWLESCTSTYAAQGVPWELARRVASLESLFPALDIVDLGSTLDVPVDAVAGVYTAVGDRLRLDWLRDRVVDDLPRADRWQALARNAVRDDVYGEHRAITAAVLRTASGGADDPPDAAIDRWIAAQGGAVERALAVLDDVKTHGVYDLATLSVALRELRNLAP